MHQRETNKKHEEANTKNTLAIAAMQKHLARMDATQERTSEQVDATEKAKSIGVYNAEKPARAAIIVALHMLTSMYAGKSACLAVFEGSTSIVPESVDIADDYTPRHDE